MQLTGYILCDMVVSLFISFYLASLFPARAGKERIRLILCLLVAVLIGFSNYTDELQLSPLPGLVSIIGTVLNNIFRLWIFYRLTEASYSKYLITYLVVGRLYGCFFNIFTSLVGTRFFVLNNSTLWVQIIAIITMVVTEIALKNIFAYQGTGLNPGVLQFYLAMFFVVLVFSATTFFTDHQIDPEGIETLVTIAILTGAVIITLLIFSSGLLLYQQYFKRVHKKQLSKWEKDLNADHCRIQAQETQLRQIRHDQINLTGALSILLQHRDVGEAEVMIQDLLKQSWVQLSN